MRLFDLFKAAGSIFRGIAPRVWRRAHKSTHRFAVAEIDELHGDDLIDNAGKLAASLAALHLRLPSREAMPSRRQSSAIDVENRFS